jgi:hypothetical protein
MPAFIYRELAWFFLSFIGLGVIVIPGEPTLCNACRLLTIGLGVISVVIGTIGFVFGRRSSNPIPARQ